MYSIIFQLFIYLGDTLSQDVQSRCEGVRGSNQGLRE